MLQQGYACDRDEDGTILLPCDKKLDASVIVSALYTFDGVSCQIQEVTWKRKERSEGPPLHEDETNRRALIDFCAARHEQFDIVDQHPVGLIFANTGLHLMPMPPSYPAVMGYPSLLPQHWMDDHSMVKVRMGVD
jgi:hypothetical protein